MADVLERLDAPSDIEVTVDGIRAVRGDRDAAFGVTLVVTSDESGQDRSDRREVRVVLEDDEFRVCLA